MSIIRNSTFIGKGVLGSTVGAPLSADANGLLVSGIATTEVTATAAVTAGTGADALLTGMTITPVLGTYLVLFSCDLNCSTAGAATSFSIYVGGSQIAASLRKVAPFDGGTLSAGSARCGVAINSLVTVNGSQAIEIRWSASNGTNQASTRILDVVRMS